jgi:putative zinc finger protein
MLEGIMHLDEGTIHAWLDGALDAEEAARVERHAAECGSCAAAVAEARGLVAGASRILTALDRVPGGVVPKAAGSADVVRARRTRSLWATLHLTPARAAAAALVVVAAGTALVLNNMPNATRSAAKLADYPRDSAVTFRPAEPINLPHAQPDTAASQTSAAAPLNAPSPARSVPKMAAPQPLSAPSRRAVAAEGGEGRVAEKAAARQADKPEMSVSTTAGIVDSLATKKESAMPRSAAADNVMRGGVAGAVSAPAAPPSAVAQRAAPKPLPEARLATGCYVVTADSGIALPARLWLDSALVPSPAMLQRSGVAADLATIQSHSVSEIVNDTRRAIAGASWTPRRDGSIRLSLPTSSVNVDLRPTSGSMFIGIMPVGDRSATVTLRRVACGS